VKARDTLRIASSSGSLASPRRHKTQECARKFRPRQKNSVDLDITSLLAVDNFKRREALFYAKMDVDHIQFLLPMGRPPAQLVGGL